MVSEVRARRLERDPRSVEELVSVVLEDSTSDAAWEAVGTLQCRGSRTEFELASRCAVDASPEKRTFAANVLGQLGWGDQTFVDESVPILLKLLTDDEAAVIGAAAVALGHRSDPRAVSHLTRLVEHEEPDVRADVAFALTTFAEQPDALVALVRLSADPVRDVRDWATAGVAWSEADSPEVRDALWARTSDEDPEIRGEALLGLAQRHDKRVVATIVAELNGEFFGNWAVEAAGILGDSTFLPPLRALWARLGPGARDRFKNEFLEAIEACGGDSE